MDQVTFDKDGSSGGPPPLNVDDDQLYQHHSDSGEESEEEGTTQGNINSFKHRLIMRDSESASETGSVGSKSPVAGDMEERRKEERRKSDSSDEDIIIEHVSPTQNVSV